MEDEPLEAIDGDDSPPDSIWQLRPILLAVSLVLLVFATWNWIFVLWLILTIFGCDFLAQH
jgi:hypothetical protein